MRLVIQRMNRSGVILGTLSVDGVHECFTLEDPDTANDRIAAGTYKVIIDDSARFKRKMPHIIGSAAIDDRGIRIHAGNTEADTVGCILVGREHTTTALQLSKAAFDAFFAKLESALSRGEVVTLELVEFQADPRPSTNAKPETTPLATRPGNIMSQLVALIQTLFSHSH